MWLLLIVGIFPLIHGGYSVTNAESEFFQSEEATFQCEHNLAVAELLQVEWKKYAESCALMDLNNGNVVRIKYPCGWEARANMTATNVTIFSLEPSDDGEFSCTALKSGYVPVNGARFNLTVNVRPKNHRLLYNGTSYNCNDEVTVNSAPNNLTLKCSVESKPQATFTWSTDPPLNESLLSKTECDKGSDLVYNCTNVLTLPSDKIRESGIVVTCNVQVAGITKDLCMKFAPLTTTTQLITTTVEETSTSSPSTTTAPLTTAKLITTSVETTTKASPSTTTAAAITGEPTTTTIGTTGTSTSSATTTTPVSTATTKSGSDVIGETRSSTSSPTTATQRLSSYKARMRLTNQKYENDMGNSSSRAFNKLAVEVCGSLNDSFKTSLVSCNVTDVRNGSVLVDAILQFNQDALKEELKDLLVTDSIEKAIRKIIQRSTAPLFRDAEISITADDTTKSSTTTAVNPTSPPVSKWNNLYILPIILGLSIIIIVIVLITYRLKNNSSTSSDGNHARNSHKPPYAMQTAVQHTYDTIPDTTPAEPHMKLQQHYPNNDVRQQHKAVQGQPSKNCHGAIRRSEPVGKAVQGQPNKNSHGAMRRSEPERKVVQGQPNKNSHGAMRRSEPADRNANYRRPGQMHKKGHGATRGSEPTQVNEKQSRPHVDRQLQHNSVANAGYPVYRGYSAYRGYPAYRHYPPYGGYPATR